MELVLFIILGGILLSRILADRGALSQAKSNFQKEHDENKHDYELWISSVTDRSVEIELQDFIYENTRPISKKKSDSQTVGWMSPKLREQLSDIPSDVLDYCTLEKELLLVLMVKMGKLPWEVAEWGIDCCGDNCTTPGRSMFQRQHRFLVWVDEELQKHGVEPMLFKKSSEPLQKTDLAKGITTSHMGKYCWWSGRLYV